MKLHVFESDIFAHFGTVFVVERLFGGIRPVGQVGTVCFAVKTVP